MKKCTSIIISIVFALGTLFSSTALCFALFSDLPSAVTSQLSEIKGEKSNGVVAVASEFDLKRACFDNRFNSPDMASSTEQRRIVTLTSDIVLTSNLAINADMGFDLGNFSIDLNGYTMTLKHAYYGSFEITSTGGKIFGDGDFVIDLQNAVIDFDSLNSNVQEGTQVTILPYDEARLANDIFEMVNRKIVQGDNGKYYHDSIDLPLHYMNFDNISLTYTSGNPSVLTNEGVVVADSADLGVTISLVIAFEGGGTYNRDFKVRIITLDRTEAWANAEFSLFCQTMLQYKGETTDTYYFGDSIVLPGVNKYTNSTYSYRVYADDNGAIGARLDTSTPYIVSEFDTNNQYIFNTAVGVPSGKVWLRFVSSKATGVENYILVSVINDRDAYEGASSLFADNMGENYEYQTLSIELETTVGDVYYYTEHDLLTSGEVQIAGMTIDATRFEYEFEDSENCPYEVIKAGNRVYVSVKPEYWGLLDSETEDAYLKATIFYGEGASAQLGVEYIKVCFTESLERDFYPYYKYLDYMLKTAKTDNSYTYLSFDMPTKVSGKKPYVQYEIEEIDAGAREYIEPDFEYSAEVSFDRSISECNFTVDTTKLSAENHRIRIYYWYSFDGQNWSKYRAGSDSENPGLEDMYYTEITLMGVVCDSSVVPAIPDQNLFDAIYSQYGGTQETNFDGTAIKVIPTDNLKTEAPRLDVPTLRATGKVSGDIANLTGIDLLAGTLSINLRNCLVDGATDISPLSGMENLVELNLGENGIGDMRPLFQDDGTGLSKMKKLETLWLDNNAIQTFYNLDLFPSLKTLYTSGNESTSFIDRILALVRSNTRLYGSTGLYSLSTYNKAMANGTVIYNEYNSSTGVYSYSGSGSEDSYAKGQMLVSEIEYQITTSSPLFDYENASANDRIGLLRSLIYGNQASVSTGWFSTSTIYVPSTNGFSVIAQGNNPPGIVITEEHLGGNEYIYTIQVQAYIQSGALSKAYTSVLEDKIAIKYIPETADVTYIESEPVMIMMMPEEEALVIEGEIVTSEAGIEVPTQENIEEATNGGIEVQPHDVGEPQHELAPEGEAEPALEGEAEPETAQPEPVLDQEQEQVSEPSEAEIQPEQGEADLE